MPGVQGTQTARSGCVRLSVATYSLHIHIHLACIILALIVAYQTKWQVILQNTPHCMKSEFLCSLWQRKESFMPRYGQL